MGVSLNHFDDDDLRIMWKKELNLKSWVVSELAVDQEIVRDAAKVLVALRICEFIDMKGFKVPPHDVFLARVLLENWTESFGAFKLVFKWLEPCQARTPKPWKL